MKTLILARHAKSSWNFPELEDHDRPLNRRGTRDALTMANYLAQRATNIDLLISSTALRATQFSDEIRSATNSTLSESRELYTFDAFKLKTALRSVDDAISVLVAVGHNPAITELCNSLSGTQIENVPTSGLVCLKIEVDHWADIGSPNIGHSGTKLQWFETPKALKANSA